VRPEYPDALIQDVMEFGGLRAGMRVLEVGAGTGLATLPVARRGLRVHCIEPSHAMAAILAAKCASMPNVTVDVVDFSQVPLERSGYDAVIAAQCWQYLHPVVRLQKSAHALGDRRILAVFWNSMPYPTGQLATKFNETFREYAPEVLPEAGRAVSAARRPQQRFAADTDLFEDVILKNYHGERVYSADEYISLLNTYGEYPALPAHRRSALYAALREHISQSDGRVEMGYNTILHMARRSSR
jgi:SAM-dependent methyltransferase